MHRTVEQCPRPCCSPIPHTCTVRRVEELRLRIVLNGDGALVRDGRLSLSLFLEPLRLLLVAYQKTAAGIVRQTSDSDNDAESSYTPAAASALDLEIAAITSGSLDVSFSPRQRPALGKRARRVEDLEVAAADRLIEDLDAERRGLSRNQAAREFLRKLPPQVERQRYELRRGVEVLRAAEFTKVTLYRGADPVPSARFVTGVLTSMCFEKDREFIELRVGTALLKFKCTREQVDRAVDLRNGVIACMYVAPLDQPARVLWLRSHSEQWRASDEAINAHVLERWNDVFARLAR